MCVACRSGVAFKCSAHEFDCLPGPDQGATETVSIGVLAHDIHTGETNFAQFDDGALER